MAFEGTQASIRVRFHGPTNYKGARHSVSDDGMGGNEPKQKIFIPFAYELDRNVREAAAAQRWLDRFNPGARIEGVGLSFDGDTYFTWEFNKEGDE